MSDFLRKGIKRIGFRRGKTGKYGSNKRKNLILIILITSSGLFYLSNIWLNQAFFAKADEKTKINWTLGSRNDNEKISLADKTKEKRELVSKIESQYAVAKKENNENEEFKEFEKELCGIVGDAPVREMIPHIAKHDRKIAGMVVGIAKKESDWGKHAPSKNGETCYNYWGYKSAGSRGTAAGYACFGSTEEAVETVAGKIENLANKNLDTPAEMVVWKCGRSCAGHDPGSVKKWISDVSRYYNQIAYNK